MTSPSNILIIQTSFIGDVILATALLESIHQESPEANLSILVRKGNESLFEHHPFIKQVIVWDKKQSKYSSLWKTIRKVRAEKFDWIINTHRFASSGIMTWLSGASTISGYKKNPFAFAYTHALEHEFNGKHETERNQALINALGSFQLAKPKLYPSADDFASVQVYQDKPYYTIAPTSVWFTKQWTPHKWIELIDALPVETNVFLLGAPNDAESCERIARQSNRSVQNMAGKFSLLQSAALMSNAKMNYVNDSAPMHLCSAVNAPVTAIYCSTIPQFGFGPLSDASHIIETKEKLDCRPCGIHGHQSCPKGHFKCSESIEISMLPQ